MQTLRRELRLKLYDVLMNNQVDDLAMSELLADAAMEVSGIQKREETKIVIQQADKKVDAILASMAETKDRWPGREKMPEAIRDLLDVFVECTGIKPIRGQINDWMATGSDWVEMGAQKADIRDAVEKSRPNVDQKRTGFTVGRPGSLTTTIQAVVGERRTKPKSNGNMKEFLDRYALEHPNE